MSKVVLIIDDDAVLRETLACGLCGNDFAVLTAESAEHADDILTRVTPDAIVLDRMMVGKDGLSFLRDLRLHNVRIPVIMLTAMSGGENAIDGLSAGADDYLAKPFQLRELVLRLNNIMGKNSEDLTCLPTGLVLSDGEFFVDVDGNRRILTLSNEEKRFLRALVNPMGSVIEASPMVVKRLRTKLNSVLSSIDIITVRGRGYKLVNGG